MMRSKFSFLVLVLVAAVSGSGCVGLKKYKATESQSADRQTQLMAAQTRLEQVNKDLDGANASRNQLQAEVDQLKASNADLSQALNAKKGELSKMVAVLNAEKKELQDQVASLTKAEAELKAKQDRDLAETKNAYDGLVSQLQNEIKEGQVAITNIQGKLSVNVAEKLFFESGKTEITSRGREILLQVGTILKKVENKQIRIEGYTDNVPIGAQLADRYPTNWDLSAARAIKVVRFLQENAGVPPELLSAAGYGPYRPVASNDNPEGRAKNRRIEIVVIDKDVAQVFVPQSSLAQ